LQPNCRWEGHLYTESPGPYSGLTELDYPFHDRGAIVTSCGRICFGRLKVKLSAVFSGQLVAIREVEDQWLVSILDYDLGFFDSEKGRVEPAPDPFVPGRLLTMCPERTL
jgi:putative transposase